MGGTSSKVDPQPARKHDGFLQQVKDHVNDEVSRRMMIQREVQMAVQMARARDNLWIFGSAWATLVTGAGTARLLGHHPPSLVAVPIVIGALALGNLADLAYGNKMLRVVKEAEYILEHERGRMVPLKQASFFKFYDETERAAFYDTATPVGELFPNYYIARPSTWVASYEKSEAEAKP